MNLYQCLAIHVSFTIAAGIRRIDAAIQMIRKNGIMCDYYARLTGRSMERMRALIAGSRKLLRIIHAIVRDNRDYVEQYQTPGRRVIKMAA